MFIHVAKAAGLFAALFLLVTPVSAQDISAAVARMDAIIAEMEKLRTEFALLSTQVNGGGSSVAPAPAVEGAASGKTLTMDLSYGVTNEDIARIQRLLATDATIYEYGVDSGFFGPKTQEAIRNFQTRFGLDPVGVIGPATTALFEVFFAAYPDENYPVGVLAKKPTVVPTVQGVTTTVSLTPTSAVTTGVNPADEINVEFDSGEALIEIRYTNGNRKGLIADTDDEDEVVDYIASKTVLTVSQIEAVIDFGRSSRSSRDDDDDEDYDEGDAEDALDDADEAIEDAADEIDEADADGEDIDWAEETLEEAEDALAEAEDAFEDEDWDEAVELAKEAEALAKDAEDRIGEEEDNRGSKGDSDEIDVIDVRVTDEDEARVMVEYENGDDYEFEVEEDRKDSIIAEIADELDMDEDDVEDLIEFDWGDIDEIDAYFEEDRVRVEIAFASGVSMRLILDEDLDEDEVIEEIADELEADEDDIEDVINFEYDN